MLATYGKKDGIFLCGYLIYGANTNLILIKDNSNKLGFA